MRQLRQLTESTCLIVKLSGEVIKKVAAIDSVMRWKGRRGAGGEERVIDSMEYQSDQAEGHNCTQMYLKHTLTHSTF